ncbi:carbohydrate ABC transporter permease [Paenibacillus roseipurpureus]|uniref:Carbohydrate ABC transporter permease n=1 Tax=Paenibacillus roseopurpureus TaxID=2918901 RepID=A0AA96RII8_9BACL|nr:carbohydrate ABC transporter permease [Paenibacillus sp. MBLB1832]WNR42860.1 carbohydrate ABC transporter permease [Paenibacillus sp. MBLB1832]
MKRIYTLAIYIFFLCTTAIFLYPIYFPIASSMKGNTEIFSSPFALPTLFKFENYLQAWQVAKIGLDFRNSMLLSTGTVVLCLLVSSMGAYILSRFRFRIKSLIYVYFLIGMMIPIQSTILPLTYIIGKLQWTDNYLVIVLLFVTTNLPIAIFILTGFMSQIPTTLEESGIMDGAGILTIFSTIIIPLSTPAIATVSIFVFLQSWNDLLIPLIFIHKPNLQSISLGLLSFKGQYGTEYGALMAAMVISIVPPLAVYMAAQEKVQSGLTAGAVKG